MYDNAKVTIQRQSTSHDQGTGYKTSGSPTTIFSDVRCLFSEKPNGRSVFANGIEQYTKPVPQAAIYQNLSGVIQVGDTAIVTDDATGTAVTYTVNAANKVNALNFSHWIIELEAIKTP